MVFRFAIAAVIYFQRKILHGSYIQTYRNRWVAFFANATVPKLPAIAVHGETDTGDVARTVIHANERLKAARSAAKFQNEPAVGMGANAMGKSLAGNSQWVTHYGLVAFCRVPILIKQSQVKFRQDARATAKPRSCIYLRAHRDGETECQ